VSPSRRSVLAGLGAGGVVVAGGLIGWKSLVDDGSDDGATTTSTTEPAPPEPTSSLAEALVAVGGRYLEEHPDEADEAALLAALPALEGEVPERPGQALRALADQAAADHEAGDTVVLDGWVLSVTECRAAALYAV
jgi:hypothetical protein